MFLIDTHGWGAVGAVELGGDHPDGQTGRRCVAGYQRGQHPPTGKHANAGLQHSGRSDARRYRSDPGCRGGRCRRVQLGKVVSLARPQ
jgi:hypothetical protein